MKRDSQKEHRLASLLCRELPVECFDEADSTNSLLKERLNNGDMSERLAVAGRQTGGRGRRGKSFFSPDGGVYMSLCVACAKVESSLFYTALAAVVTVRAIKKVLNIDTGIKWVNDIFLGGKKLAGILCECKINGDGSGNIVIGIGINTFGTPFPPELETTAASVKADEDRKTALIAEICNGIFRGINPDELLKEYKDKCITLNTTVNGAKAVDISPSFGLVLEKDGERRILKGITEMSAECGE